jgi:uncharacterized protein (DUF58 family)
MTWTPTPALRRGIGVGALALLAAAALGRPALVLLAVPFVFGTALSLVARPDRSPQATFTLDPPATVEGGLLAARVTVSNDTAERMLCVVTVRVPAWIRLDYGVGSYAAWLRPRATTAVAMRGTARRWGSYRLGPVSLRAVACDGLLEAGRVVLPAVPLTVYPAGAWFDSEEALPRAAGIVGMHRSRRPGDGVELAEVRPFQAGDRLRRINWRVTQRTGTLHVNATLSDRDAEVVLLLDVRQEAGTPGGLDGTSSILDATVRAAAAIAEHYVRQGDRVALLEYGPQLRRLPAGTGRRHYLAALEWLAHVNPDPAGSAPGYRIFLPGVHPPTALLIVLSPLLDTDSANLLATLVRAGRSPITVDTLPDGMGPPVAGVWAAAAMRLWRLERANLIGRLRGIGVPVEPWRGSGSLDLMLRHAYRLATGSRVLRR